MTNQIAIAIILLELITVALVIITTTNGRKKVSVTAEVSKHGLKTRFKVKTK